jgi:hypothetical protein
VGIEYKFAFRINTAGKQFPDPGKLGLRKTQNIIQIEPERNLCIDLVDVLTAGAP